MYQILHGIQCVNTMACAGVTANSSEGTPQAFQRTWQGLCCAVELSAQQETYKWTGVPGEAEWPLRKSWFIGSRAKCFLGLDQVFSKCDSVIASLVKGG